MRVFLRSAAAGVSSKPSRGRDLRADASARRPRGSPARSLTQGEVRPDVRRAKRTAVRAVLNCRIGQPSWIVAAPSSPDGTIWGDSRQSDDPSPLVVLPARSEVKLEVGRDARNSRSARDSSWRALARDRSQLRLLQVSGTSSARSGRGTRRMRGFNNRRASASSLRRSFFEVDSSGRSSGRLRSGRRTCSRRRRSLGLTGSSTRSSSFLRKAASFASSFSVGSRLYFWAS